MDTISATSELALFCDNTADTDKLALTIPNVSSAFKLCNFLIEKECVYLSLEVQCCLIVGNVYNISGFLNFCFINDYNKCPQTINTFKENRSFAFKDTGHYW